jgi:hypothetical protein
MSFSRQKWLKNRMDIAPIAFKYLTQSLFKSAKEGHKKALRKLVLARRFFAALAS